MLFYEDTIFFERLDYFRFRYVNCQACIFKRWFHCDWSPRAGTTTIFFYHPISFPGSSKCVIPTRTSCPFIFFILGFDFVTNHPICVWTASFIIIIGDSLEFSFFFCVSQTGIASHYFSFALHAKHVDYFLLCLFWASLIVKEKNFIAWNKLNRGKEGGGDIHNSS